MFAVNTSRKALTLLMMAFVAAQSIAVGQPFAAVLFPAICHLSDYHHHQKSLAL